MISGLRKGHNMIYNSFSLNGTWDMEYSDTAYTDTELPQFMGFAVENAVPGHWEDMIDSFRYTGFFLRLRVNPEYGLQSYPIAYWLPDMALPNIMGNFFYRRTFTCDNVKNPAALHFEGVQNSVSVWLNDTFLTRHEGYSTPFDVEIPDGLLVEGENTVVLSVSNFRLKGYDNEPVSGITSRAADEYTGGITGNVELRVYNCPLRDAAVLISPDCKSAEVRVDCTEKTDFEWQVCGGETVISSGKADGDFTFDTARLARWSPESPWLYTLKLICGEGVLERKFGVRRLVADGVHLRLNSRPYYLRGACEHCYYPDTVNPPHDINHYRMVIRNLKKLGFNFIRFHTYIPYEEYLCAADELGILLHIESPSNTSLAEWKEIVKFCRRHPSAVIYCCGNELQMDDDFIKHQHKCADVVHADSDALFSPLSALRGVEYGFEHEPDQASELVTEPFKHHPRRFKEIGEFSDVYSSYALGDLSYNSLKADPEKLDARSVVYQKPRLSHEICIDGTYTDLSLKSRYKNSRIGKTDMFDSIERHLEEKGLLQNAPLYFKNSCEWQRRVRKYCFEAARRCETIAGYDFLGPIDTHWHTFGYDVGMMNEFYELKPSETVRNVLMYNGETVLLNDLGTHVNFACGDKLKCGIFTSYYGANNLFDAKLNLRLTMDGRIIARRSVDINNLIPGRVSKLYDFETVLPEVYNPASLKLYAVLDGGDTYVENEWELCLFPKVQPRLPQNVIVSDGMSEDELEKLMREGKDVVLLGAKPFESMSMSFRIALAGRPFGNLATVINDHPILEGMPHEGFCGWQFSGLMNGGRAICLDADVPFDPIIEVVSTHKYAIKQAALFEFNVLNGRLLVSGFNFKEADPSVLWLKDRMIAYAESDKFNPKHTLDAAGLHALVNADIIKSEENINAAVNFNDKAAKRKKKQEN